MNLGASLDRDELYLNNDYLSFLSDVLRYKYFIKRKKYPKPSEVYDYIISNETFLKGKLRVAILKRYLKGIGTSEKRKFDQYLIKFKDVALEKEHLDFLERALNYQKELNGLTNESTGSLRRMKDETVYDFKKVLEREKGKVVLVDFWASWCGPCRKETPFLEKMISSINDSKFIVVSISMDKDSKAWERASKMDGFDKKKHNYLIVDWEKSSLYSDYKIKTIPRYILFNKTGEIIDDDAPRPSNKELKKLIEDNINKASL
jgi:thiol-disulfide isomerase/thioredoxin